MVERRPPKHPEVRAPSPRTSTKKIGTSHHRDIPVTWDGLLGQDREPDINTATGIYGPRMQTSSFSSTRAQIYCTLSDLPRSSCGIFCVPLNFSPVEHRPISHLIFPRTSQSPRSRSLAATKTRTNNFRVLWWDVSILWMRASTVNFGPLSLGTFLGFFLPEQKALIPSKHL